MWPRGDGGVGAKVCHQRIEVNFSAEGPSLAPIETGLEDWLAHHGVTIDSTLVLVSTEFGRTPKINGNAGRDHWPKVFSVLLAGGGIKKGLVFGSSDATAAEPDSDALGVEDLATTIYHQLGIVADKELIAPGPRPLEIVDGGKVRKELLA